MTTTQPTCDTVVVIPLLTAGTCWLNSILMALMTGSMRQLVQQSLGPVSKTLIKDFEALNKQTEKRTVLQMLQVLFSLSRQSKDDWDFRKNFIHPINILESLLQALPREGVTDNIDQDGGDVRPLSTLLKWLKLDPSYIIVKRVGAKFALPSIDILDVMSIDGRGKHSYKRNKDATSKILIFAIENDQGAALPFVEGDEFDLTHIITYNNAQYVCDSMFLSGMKHSDYSEGHSIVGITCEGKRYVYDGGEVRRATGKGRPCHILELDWLSDVDFGINRETCSIVGPTDPSSRFHYSTKSGYDKTFVYIRQDTEGPGTDGSELLDPIKYPTRGVNATGAPVVVKSHLDITTLSSFKDSVSELTGFKPEEFGFSFRGFKFKFANDSHDRVVFEGAAVKDAVYMQAVLQAMILLMHQFHADTLVATASSQVLKQAADDCQSALHMVFNLISRPSPATPFTRIQALTGDRLPQIFTQVSKVLVTTLGKLYKTKTFVMHTRGDVINIGVDKATGVIHTTMIMNMSDVIVCNANISAALFFAAATADAEEASIELENVGPLIAHFLRARYSL